MKQLTIATDPIGHAEKGLTYQRRRLDALRAGKPCEVLNPGEINVLSGKDNKATQLCLRLHPIKKSA